MYSVGESDIMTEEKVCMGGETMPAKVSVIIPVYKVESFVRRAVQSILTQTLREIEVYCVDDGSPDRSGEILDEMAAADARLHVIHQENAGAPAARNVALEKCSGEYVYFCDADDWAEPEMLEDLVRLCEENRLQMAVAGFDIDTHYGNEGAFVRQTLQVDDEIFATQQAFREGAYRLFDKNLFYPPWNKLIRRDYLMENGIRFPQTFWDDFPFVLSCIRDIAHVGVTHKAYYHFQRARAESETARYRADMYEKREEEHQWMLDLYAHWGISDARSMEMVYRRYIERVVGCVENMASVACKEDFSTRRARVKQMITAKEARKALALAKPHSLMMRIMLLPLKWKMPTLCLLEGRFIGWIKRRNAGLFARLKAGR